MDGWDSILLLMPLLHLQNEIYDWVVLQLDASSRDDGVELGLWRAWK